MYQVVYSPAASNPSPELGGDVSVLLSQIGKVVLGPLTLSASQLARVDWDFIDGSWEAGPELSVSGSRVCLVATVMGYMHSLTLCVSCHHCVTEQTSW